MSKLDDVWDNIKDQVETYLKLDSLSGSERSEAGMKVVFGIRKFRKDVDWFMVNAATGDPRRPAVQRVQAIMDKIGLPK